MPQGGGKHAQQRENGETQTPHNNNNPQTHLVREDLDAGGEALEAEVEVGAVGALDAHAAADVLVAVVAVVQAAVCVLCVCCVVLFVCCCCVCVLKKGEGAKN